MPRSPQDRAHGGHGVAQSAGPHHDGHIVTAEHQTFSAYFLGRPAQRWREALAHRR